MCQDGCGKVLNCSLKTDKLWWPSLYKTDCLNGRAKLCQSVRCFSFKWRTSRTHRGAAEQPRSLGGGDAFLIALAFGFWLLVLQAYIPRANERLRRREPSGNWVRQVLQILSKGEVEVESVIVLLFYLWGFNTRLRFMVRKYFTSLTSVFLTGNVRYWFPVFNWNRLQICKNWSFVKKHSFWFHLLIPTRRTSDQLLLHLHRPLCMHKSTYCIVFSIWQTGATHRNLIWSWHSNNFKGTSLSNTITSPLIVRMI